ncbi:MAG: hypothetical protein P9L92_06760 [Candidatus Electryonea clarkiae]|nr:hypothetical protein [Candidatus Electryonea clarkiae]MDP8286743.1 hypothetical protein [Candidatus Electryonea clarkiae]
MRFITVVVLVIVPVCLFAQLSYKMIDPNVNDARAYSMGKTEILSSYSSNSVFSNPAHLALIQNRTFQLGGRGWMGKTEDEYNDWVTGFSVDEKYKLHPKLTHLSIAMPYALSGSDILLGLGAGFNTINDLGTNYLAEIDRDDIEIEINQDINGGINVISVGGGVHFSEKYSLGLSFNKSIMSKYLEVLEVESRTSDGVDFDYEEEYSADFSTTFINLGGIAIVNEQFTVGFMYRNRFEMEVSNLEYSYKDADSSSSDEGSDIDITIPSTTGFSAAYQLDENTLIVGEYQTRSWKDLEYDEENAEIDNGSAIRLGAEFGQPSKFRVGYYSESVAATNGDLLDEDPLKKSGFTVGAGFGSDQFKLDIFFDYGWMNYEYEYEGFDYQGNPVNKDLEVKNNFYVFGASCTFNK